jgi:transposase InsO family protein
MANLLSFMIVARRSSNGTNPLGTYVPILRDCAEKLPIFGAPEEDKISTSHIERFNLTVRMTLRRFTRLTNAHSKSLRHHTTMQALFVAWYNFARKHETRKGQTPAMASGLSDHIWTTRELIERTAEA